MRRLVALAMAAAGALALVRRRRRSAERVTVAFADGSSLTLEAGSAEGDRLLALARPALQP